MPYKPRDLVIEVCLGVICGGVIFLAVCAAATALEPITGWDWSSYLACAFAGFLGYHWLNFQQGQLLLIVPALISGGFVVAVFSSWPLGMRLSLPLMIFAHYGAGIGIHGLRQWCRHLLRSRSSVYSRLPWQGTRKPVPRRT